MFLFRRIRKRIKSVFAIIAAITVAFSVGGNKAPDEPVSETKGLVLSTVKSETTSASSEGNSTTSVEDKETYIILADDMTFIKGEGASFSDGVVTVEKGGTYLFKGALNEGRILVNLKDEDEVVLKFYGATVISSKGAPVSVLKSHGRTVLNFANGTVNTFADTDERVFSYDEDEGDSAVIFSKDDIVLTGDGNLNIKAKFNKGIFSKKDITLKGVNLNIVSFDDGIRSNDSILVENSKLDITAGGDGIHLSNKNRDTNGKILVYNSKISLLCEYDGMDCAGDILICDGELDIMVADGSTGRNYRGNHDFIFNDNNIPDKNKNEIFATGRATADSSTFERLMGKSAAVSGVATEGEAVFSDTVMKINSAQHGFDCESIEIENGYCFVKSDGNGLYAEDEISVDGADVNIMAYSNGIESENIRLVDGKIFISALNEALVSSEGDDGIEIDSALVQTERLPADKSILSKP